MTYTDHGLPYMGLIPISRLFKFFWRTGCGLWMPRTPQGEPAPASGQQYVRALHTYDDGAWSLVIDGRSLCALSPVLAHTPAGPQRALVGAFGLSYFVIMRNPPPKLNNPSKPYRGPCATLYLSPTPPRLAQPESQQETTQCA